ncbi:MAG: hypothetical protein HN718_06635 [Rhodospirillales bacterium]|jgi:hypothetical protein|nr:hypothetical protein [Rhodospirillales bacterium]MBT7778188.1 hypothetical protein [Rhodospirillales bacterium]
MNPYSITNPLNPTAPATAEATQSERIFEPALSRAAYRLVNKVDALLFNRGR